MYKIQQNHDDIAFPLRHYFALVKQMSTTSVPYLDCHQRLYAGLYICSDSRLHVLVNTLKEIFKGRLTEAKHFGLRNLDAFVYLKQFA